jgi:hypothetical protein
VRRLVAVNPNFPPALHRRIDTIRNQIQKDARNLLRAQIDHSGRRIKRSLQLDVEFLLLRSRAVVRKIEAVFNDGIDVYRAALIRTLTRMQQHVFDNRVGTPAVLDYLFEIFPSTFAPACRTPSALFSKSNGPDYISWSTAHVTARWEAWARRRNQNLARQRQPAKSGSSREGLNLSLVYRLGAIQRRQ